MHHTENRLIGVLTDFLLFVEGHIINSVRGFLFFSYVRNIGYLHLKFHLPSPRKRNIAYIFTSAFNLTQITKHTKEIPFVFSKLLVCMWPIFILKQS